MIDVNADLLLPNTILEDDVQLPLVASPNRSTPTRADPELPHSCCVKGGIMAIGGESIITEFEKLHAPDDQAIETVTFELPMKVVEELYLSANTTDVLVDDHCPGPLVIALIETDELMHPYAGSEKTGQHAVLVIVTIKFPGAVHTEMGVNDKLNVDPICDEIQLNNAEKVD